MLKQILMAGLKELGYEAAKLLGEKIKQTAISMQRSAHEQTESDSLTNTDTVPSSRGPQVNWYKNGNVNNGPHERIGVGD